MFRQRFLVGMFLVLLFLGIGLRMFDFGNLLIFKSDQARDALIMEQVLSGESIPLLGPQVGGTPLRLGPITYYFQYISGLLFGNTPESFAYPELLFGILTIPLLFVFLRRFCTVPVTLILTALASISFVLVTFSRFAWNPNSLPFFTTLFAYAFLRAEEQAGRSRYVFLAVSAVALGIIFQLHVAASIGIVLGILGYLLCYRTFSLKEIVGVIFLVMILHAPMILSEIQTRGENVGYLVEEYSERGAEQGKHNVIEKGFRSFQRGSQFVWLVITGDIAPKSIETRGFSIKCDKECRRSVPITLVIIVSFVVLAVLAGLQFFREADAQRKRQLWFLLLWFVGFALFTVPIAYELETRFYLGIITPLFIFLGLALQSLLGLIRKELVRYIGYALVLLLMLSHLYTTIQYLSGLKQASVSAAETAEDLRFGTAPKVTLGQLRGLAREVASRANPNTPIFVSGENLYVKSLYYVLSHEHGFTGCYMRGEKNAVPSGMTHVLLRYTGDSVAGDEKDFLVLGTLSVRVELASGTKSVETPSNCLTY